MSVRDGRRLPFLPFPFAEPTAGVHTPLAILCGINKAAQSGIIVKGGAPMEQVGRIQAAVFDKTGTITYGTPFVEEIIPLNHETEKDLIYNDGGSRIYK